MIIVDAHQDLAWNILTFGRDYSLSAHKTRQREIHSDTPHHNGDTLLGWPDYQRGRVAIIFATLFAAPLPASLGPWETQVYADANQAHKLYRAQLDEYFRLIDRHPNKFRLLSTQKDTREVLERWSEVEDFEAPKTELTQEPEENGKRFSRGQGNVEGKQSREEQEEFPERDHQNGRSSDEQKQLEARSKPVGLVPLMEGAEGVRVPSELEEWWERGVRLIGPAWAGTRFCGGTRQPGPLTEEGFMLLEAMAGIGFGLDISHMDEQAVLQALDFYSGTIFASHANAHSLLKGMETNRHLSDRVIHGLLERDGVIGIVPYNRFLLPGWTPSDGRQKVTLDFIFAQIDYICQMAGDARHVGLGTDFDGGFGVQSVPAEFDTIADLRKLIPLMTEKGYAEKDIAAILGLNWVTVLNKILPEE